VLPGVGCRPAPLALVGEAAAGGARSRRPRWWARPRGAAVCFSYIFHVPSFVGSLSCNFPLVCLCCHCRWMTSWCDALKIVWWRVSSCILAFGWWLCNNLGKQSSKYSLVPLTICYELPEPYARMKQNVVTLIVVAHKILLFLQSPLLFITNWLCKSF